jgi:hypothetical protein
MSRFKDIDKIIDEIGAADSLYEFAESIYEDRQRIKELEEQLKNAIVPKFKIGQEVYLADIYFDKVYGLKISSISISKFKDKHFNNISYDGHLEESLFASKEEAEKRFKELKGE